MDEPLNLPQPFLSLIPTDPLTTSILNHTKSHLLPSIFNHSLRVFLYATKLYNEGSSSHAEFTHPSGTSTPLKINPSVLFAACMFHDMGTHHSCNGPQRFEVEGADAAVAFLRKDGQFTLSESRDENALHSIWCAIALHTSAGIAERIDPFTKLVRMSVKADFSTKVREDLGQTDFGREMEEKLPRLDIEAELADAVVSQATRGEKKQGLYVDGEWGQGKWTDSQKFPKASWPGVLLRGHLEKIRDEGIGWEGENPAF